MNNTCYIICDNDGTEFVVIGSEEQAKAKLEELKENCRQQCRKNYGERACLEAFNKHYWHLHDNVPFKVEPYFPEEKNNICSQCGGNKFIIGFDLRNSHQMTTIQCPICKGQGKI